MPRADAMRSSKRRRPSRSFRGNRCWSGTSGKTLPERCGIAALAGLSRVSGAGRQLADRGQQSSAPRAAKTWLSARLKSLVSVAQKAQLRGLRRWGQRRRHKGALLSDEFNGRAATRSAVSRRHSAPALRPSASRDAAKFLAIRFGAPAVVRRPAGRAAPALAYVRRPMFAGRREFFGGDCIVPRLC